MDRVISARLVIDVMLVVVTGCGSAAESPLRTAAPVAAATSSTPPTTASVPSAGPSAAGSSPVSTASIATLPVFGADEPLVLFTRVTGAGGGLFAVRPDGTGKAQLATDILPGVHKRGDWSPDGQRVVFIDETTERMWIASLDGSPTVAVPACDTPGCDFPVWSPDGTKIAFSRYESEAGVTGPAAVGIYIVDVATNEVSPVVRLERPLLADVPHWSPDGSHIVFGVDRMDDAAFETGAAIGVVPAAGGNPRYITDFDQFAYVADWGKQTDEIVYSVQALGLQKAMPASQGTWDLFAIRSDGTGGRQITHVAPGRQLIGPRWTPDGRSITAFDDANGQPVVVDPTNGEVQDFGVPGVEARPLLRPVP